MELNTLSVGRARKRSNAYELYLFVPDENGNVDLAINAVKRASRRLAVWVPSAQQGRYGDHALRIAAAYKLTYQTLSTLALAVERDPTTSSRQCTQKFSDLIRDAADVGKTTSIIVLRPDQAQEMTGHNFSTSEALHHGRAAEPGDGSPLVFVFDCCR